ncbi:hypothetical protein [Roseospira marina]|uniref:hypothetical protein n=1 Tax=Roseospira marina TaxID=140057 RepID=UPI001812872C|nr:hypothetical protein [Roseospira marina]MBB5087698.1 hypothetical protein [Roseospira marina]
MALILAALPAQAAVLSFEGLGTTFVPDGYGGFAWDTFYAESPSDYIFDDPAEVPPPNALYNLLPYPYIGSVAINRGGGAASLTRDTAFTFVGTDLMAAHNDGLEVTVTGLRDGLQKYTDTLTLDTSGPTAFDANWTDIDTLIFAAAGGVPNSRYTDISSTLFGLDQLEYTSSSVAHAPLPAAAWFLVTALGGLAGAGALRRRSSAQVVARDGSGQ